MQENDVVRFTTKSDFKNTFTKKEEAEGTPPPINEKTIERAKKIVREAGTGWDYYAIETEFRETLRTFKPDNIDGAFIGFVKHKAKTPPGGIFPGIKLPDFRCTD